MSDFLAKSDIIRLKRVLEFLWTAGAREPIFTQKITFFTNSKNFFSTNEFLHGAIWVQRSPKTWSKHVCPGDVNEPGGRISTFFGTWNSLIFRFFQIFLASSLVNERSQLIGSFLIRTGT